ncbi:hypothetical protein [Streptomyces radicis]|uniref:SWIM-type domain-containing protein n=1 Tax=Streptomyces radicis TaxID=1750517 RepID=A0A3A9X2G4_9ACTN|nr:hypothetical protein [Streptomyces radicis]RKN12707.1 hypothetical protein D7319_01815 [Streptomyces radicis]RKN27530.1 hypothetical protein D7318_01080 [Streptomyces radicis]
MTAPPALPPVAPAVTAALVAALSPRLRKRLDAAAAKLAARPVTREGDTARVAVDDEAAVELRAPGGAVTEADAIRCGCLLAPACVHRAAIASAAPVAEEGPAPDDAGDGTPDNATPDNAPGNAPEAAVIPATESAEAASPAQLAAATALWTAGAAVLETGVDGAGALAQAELLGAAHAARLAGLHRPAAAAVAAVAGLRAARSADPGHRLGDLTAALHELLTTAHGVGHATGPELAVLRGTARRPYTPGGALRLYGLFTEPVLARTGHAGVVTWTADADGRLHSVLDVMPGGAERAASAAARTVRLGDTALTHRELARAGLTVSGATVSPDGRLGAGAGVRAVRASGADWDEEPLARLWAPPAHEQAARALAALALPEARRPPGGDLLFLDLTVTGHVRESGGHVLAADCAGLPVRVTAADDHPDLAHRDNLRLLAADPGLRLRVIGRLVPATHPRLALLAAGRPPGARRTLRPADPRGRIDVGFDRLQRADLPPASDPPVPPAAADEPAPPPLHALRRRVDQAVAAGRRTLALPGADGADRQRLRRAGLATGVAVLDELHRAAADRALDTFGRLLPADADRFARAWLAAARYADAMAAALCAAAWTPEPEAAPARGQDESRDHGRVA